LLRINKRNLYDIKNEVKKNYPSECCGLLIGTNAKGKKVVNICPVENRNKDRAHDRYEISGKDFAKIDRDASKKSLQIIGIYHSHPDHPAVPSAFDTEHAWSGYSYLIVSIAKENDIEVRSWVYNEEKKLLMEEKIECYEE